MKYKIKNFLILLFILINGALYGADLNQTIVYENNVTIFDKLAKNLNKKSPQYGLQFALISKIKAILNLKEEYIQKSDFEIKNDDDYINTFFKINLLLAKAKYVDDEINAINDQLDDISEDIKKSDANLSSVLTYNLEYAYYLKQKNHQKNYKKIVEKNYEKWLKVLISNLNQIKFKTKNIDKYIKSNNEIIKDIQNKIKKINIEKQRYEILQRDTQKFLKSINELQKQKEVYVDKIIKLKLYYFFEKLKKHDKTCLKTAKEIVNYAKTNSITLYLSDSLKTTLIYMMDNVLGNWITTILSIKEHIFTFLNQNAFFGISLLKFSKALGIFLVFFFLRKIFSLVILNGLKKLSSLSKTTIDDKLIVLIEGPLKFIFIILGVYFAAKAIDIDSDIFKKIIKSLDIFVFFWIIYNIIVSMTESIYKFTKKFGKELYREIGTLFIKLLKFFIISIALVAILQEWDINVSAFIASLGLGGLAFALAAKDTASNLFGGLSILADKSLKIDDWIKVNGVEGTVEEIGLRTVKVRTFEKSLITVPNSVISGNPIENFSRRNIRRIKMRIGVTYDTSASVMQKILSDIKTMLKEHPQINQKATLLVNFDIFGASDLSIFIYCFTDTANWDEYLDIREDVNLKIMKIIEDNNASFAFPSQSLYIEKYPQKSNLDM